MKQEIEFAIKNNKVDYFFLLIFILNCRKYMKKKGKFL